MNIFEIFRFSKEFRFFDFGKKLYYIKENLAQFCEITLKGYVIYVPYKILDFSDFGVGYQHQIRVVLHTYEPTQPVSAGISDCVDLP